MAKAYLFLLIILIFLMQFSVLGQFMEQGRVPNLFVAFTVGAAVIFGFERSLGMTIFAGLLMDALGGLAMGSGTLALVLLFWTINQIKSVADLRLKRLFSVILFFAIVALALISFDILVEAVAKAEKLFLGINATVYINRMSINYVLRLLYTSLAALPIYLLLRRFSRSLQKETAIKK